MTTLDNGLTTTMMGALGSMPIRLRNVGGHWFLPHFAPSGHTIKALKDRGLIELQDHAWVRTFLGERTWQSR